MFLPSLRVEYKSPKERVWGIDKSCRILSGYAPLSMSILAHSFCPLKEQTTFFISWREKNVVSLPRRVGIAASEILANSSLMRLFRLLEKRPKPLRGGENHHGDYHDHHQHQPRSNEFLCFQPYGWKNEAHHHPQEGRRKFPNPLLP